MPYYENVAVEAPQEDQKIWRYRSLDYLKSILKKSKLHFHRIDDFEDPFEGSIPAIVAEVRRQIAESDMVKLEKEINKQMRSASFANCWHISDKELASRWEIYGYENSVAIQTTFGRLIAALDQAKQYISVGKITYIDFTSDSIRYVLDQLPSVEMRNMVQWMMVKRKSFAFENELRAIVQTPTLMSEEEYDRADYNIVIDGEKKKKKVRVHLPKHGTGTIDFRKLPSDSGMDIDVDLDTLIENIYVSPKSSDEFFQEVVSLSNQYGINENHVIKSNLASSALY
jgi:hypothetical protein